MLVSSALRSNLSKSPEKSLIFLLHSGSADGESSDSYWDKIFRRLLLDLLFVIHIPYISISFGPPSDALFYEDRDLLQQHGLFFHGGDAKVLLIWLRLSFL